MPRSSAGRSGSGKKASTVECRKKIRSCGRAPTRHRAIAQQSESQYENLQLGDQTPTMANVIECPYCECQFDLKTSTILKPGTKTSKDEYTLKPLYRMMPDEINDLEQLKQEGFYVGVTTAAVAHKRLHADNTFVLFHDKSKLAASRPLSVAYRDSRGKFHYYRVVSTIPRRQFAFESSNGTSSDDDDSTDKMSSQKRVFYYIDAKLDGMMPVVCSSLVALCHYMHFYDLLRCVNTASRSNRSIMCENFKDLPSSKLVTARSSVMKIKSLKPRRSDKRKEMKSETLEDLSQLSIDGPNK